MRYLLAMLAAAALAACGGGEAAPRPSRFKATEITGIGWGHDFHLTDTAGRPRSLGDFKGKVVLLFFGYTHCPDVCPTTLAKMAEARKALGTSAARVQVLFVTLDPERDTPEALERYVRDFDRDFLGLRADPTATAALAGEFKLHVLSKKDGPQKAYAVEHTGAVFAFDPSGRLRLLIRPEAGVDAIRADLATLLKDPS